MQLHRDLEKRWTNFRFMFDRELHLPPNSFSLFLSLLMIIVEIIKSVAQISNQFKREIKYHDGDETFQLNN